MYLYENGFFNSFRNVISGFPIHYIISIRQAAINKDKINQQTIYTSGSAMYRYDGHTEGGVDCQIHTFPEFSASDMPRCPGVMKGKT